ncbi:MAG TPA: hypothetical protein VM010_01265 [Chitinophagaceae bacterium]|nr:hypothetical protein [Chitinophagaceae bacterium]
MKKTTLYGFLAAALSVGFVACNNDGDTADTTAADSSATTMTTTTDNTATSMSTSTNNYMALADTFRTNSEAGNYLNPRTGKSMKIRVDTATGMRMDETTNEPVWRYVDKRDYKVWSSRDDNSMWDTVGTARMQNNRLEYQGDNNQWIDYDKRWKMDDDKRSKDYKTKIGDTKIKVGEDGDIKIKDKATGEKTKYDADDNKIKTKGGNNSGGNTSDSGQ